MPRLEGRKRPLRQGHRVSFVVILRNPDGHRHRLDLSLTPGLSIGTDDMFHAEGCPVGG